MLGSVLLIRRSGPALLYIIASRAPYELLFSLALYRRIKRYTDVDFQLLVYVLVIIIS